MPRRASKTAKPNKYINVDKALSRIEAICSSICPMKGCYEDGTKSRNFKNEGGA